MKKQKHLFFALAGMSLAFSTMTTVALAVDIAPAVPANPVALAGNQRYLVKYRAGMPELRDASRLTRGLDVALGRAQLNRAVAVEGSSATKPAVAARLVRRSAIASWNVVATSRLLDGKEEEDFLRELKSDPAVESVEVDHMYQHMALEPRVVTPNDPSYAQQWNLSGPGGVHAPEAWAITQGEGVVVAVVDTGIAQGNPDLMNNVLPGYDMISERRASRRDSDVRVPGGWDMGDWFEVGYCRSWAANQSIFSASSSWHGSHVAGTIAQETNNGLMVAGLANKAKVLPVRALGSCGGYTSDIADGIVWAVGGEVPGLPLNPHPAEVINMSVGSGAHRKCPSLYQEAINKANSVGTIVVVAAGNSNDSAVLYTMSGCKGVISVAATGPGRKKASFSNYGERVDIAAPGENVKQVKNTSTTRPGPDWQVVASDGTSMAAPHVAAAVAMVQSVVKTPLSLQQMRDLLRETATPFPAVTADATPIGPGVLNVHAALVRAMAACDPAEKVCPPEATPLFNKLVEEVEGGALSNRLFRFNAEAGKVLSFITLGGKGDVSLYVSHGKEPLPGQADAFSKRLGNNETVRFTAPKSGTYYVKLVGESAYTDVSLVARQ